MRYLTPTRVLLASAVAVGASTAALPFVTGYGTQLFAAVALSAWSVVAGVASAPFADAHHGPVWFVALFVNLAFFLVPAVPVFFATRRRWPMLSTLLTSAWLAFYLAALFFLFPATDGP
jgi:hypothetical protein